MHLTRRFFSLTGDFDLLGASIPENWGKRGRSTHTPTEKNSNKFRLLVVLGRKTLASSGCSGSPAQAEKDILPLVGSKLVFLAAIGAGVGGAPRRMCKWGVRVITPPEGQGPRRTVRRRARPDRSIAGQFELVG